ncbi:MAG: hypothetical protein GKR91_12830 [Pseudomonadales bacterium]|nr:hypothetical protein [Pseudomonadales bacterium]
MFIWLENTSVAFWVGTSLWAYPLLLSIHIVGLAIVVGIFSMRDLRLLGLFSALPIRVFSSLSTLAIAGFILNAISGFLLFTSQASVFVTSIPFLTKISCITVGMVLAYIIQKRLDDAVETQTKLFAMISFACWIAAIVAGRLIAYIF